jgi:penicillin V acylase-like amidase (Ntn superfamily)
MIHNISQPNFEELIAKRLAKSNLVEIRKNHTFVGLEEVSALHPHLSSSKARPNRFVRLMAMSSRQLKTALPKQSIKSARNMLSPVTEPKVQFAST